MAKRRNCGKRIEVRQQCNFGARLKGIRLRCGMRQDELGARMGVSAAQISAWEKGEIEPGVYAVAALAQIFGISTDKLIGLEPITKEDEFKFYLGWN